MKLLWIVSFCTMTQCVLTLFSCFKGKLKTPETDSLTEFKCSILYSATFHMFFTETLYFDSAFSIDTKSVKFTWDWKNQYHFPVNDYSLESEIGKTINIMFNNNMEMESIWLLYIYMYKINRFFDGTINIQNYDLDHKIRKENLDMHTFVKSILEKDIADTGCKQDNIFNKQSERCEYYTKFKDMINVGSDNVNDLITEVIKSNKEMIQLKIEDIIMKGHDDERMVQGGHFTFSGIEILYFKNVNWSDGHRTFFNQYSAGYVYSYPQIWDNILEDLNKLRLETFKDGLEGIKYLGLYQTAVVKALKIIILGLTWRCVLQSHKCGTKEFVLVLERFVKKTALEDDTNFKELVKVVNKGNSKDIIRQINVMLSIETMFHRYSSRELGPNGSHDILEVAERFLVDLDTTFGQPIVFKHCSTFSQIVYNKINPEVSTSNHILL